MSKSQETTVFSFPEPIRPYLEKQLQFCFDCHLESIDRMMHNLAYAQLKGWIWLLKDRKISNIEREAIHCF